MTSRRLPPIKTARQPQATAKIDWRNPLANGLHVAVNFSSPLVVNQAHPWEKPVKLPTGRIMAAPSGGAGWVKSDSSGLLLPYHIAQDPAETGGTGQATVALVVSQPVVSVVGEQIALHCDSTNGYLIRLQLDPTGGYSLYADNNTTNTLLTGKAKLHYQVLLGTVDLSSCTLYAPGGETKTVTGLSLNAGGKSGLRLISGNATTAKSLLQGAFLWNRVLSAGEIAAFRADPWQVFESGRFRLSGTKAAPSYAGIAEQPPPQASGGIAHGWAMAVAAQAEPAAANGSIFQFFIVANQLSPTAELSVARGNAVFGVVQQAAAVASASIITQRMYAITASARPPTANGSLIRGKRSEITASAPPPTALGQFVTVAPLAIVAVQPLPSAVGALGVVGQARQPAPLAQAAIAHGRAFGIQASAGKPSARLAYTPARYYAAEAISPSPQAWAAAAVGRVFSGAASQPSAQITVGWEKPALWSGAARQPSPSALAEMIRHGQWSLTVIQPAPSARLSLWQSVPALGAYSMNTENYGVTQYADFPFQRLGVVGGVPFGVNSAGVWRLQGADDDGEPIECRFLSGETDLNERRLKRVVVVHTDIEGAAKVLLSVNGSTTAFAVADSGAGQRARLPLAGSQVVGKRIAVGVENVDGARLTVRSLDAIIQVLPHKA